jgi:steroid delta-isomerase-like uncharacterized protein
MSVEANKAVVRRFFEELVNPGNTALADEILAPAPRYANYSTNSPEPHGREGVEPTIRMYKSAFPDFRISVVDMVAEGDKVLARLKVEGTHEGEFMGIPASGRQFSIPAMALFRIENGKIAEDRHIEDAMGMMQQLGAIPSPGQ